MKKNLFWLLGLTALLICTSCNNNSYSNARKAEKKLIKNYVSRNNLNIIDDEPAYGVWNELDYLRISAIDDNCYFHLSKPGDTRTDSIASGDICLIRYRRYGLEENPDTLSYWNTNELAFPIEFTYPSLVSPTCEAWTYAVMYMKYTGAECKLVCPSTVGFTDENSSVTPYVYELKLTIKRY